MLGNLPRKREIVFVYKKQILQQFYKHRKRLIKKLENHDLGNIGIHSFRPRYGAILYLKIKNLVII